MITFWKVKSSDWGLDLRLWLALIDTVPILNFNAAWYAVCALSSYV